MESLLNWIYALPRQWIPLVLGMLPILEVRGAIPAGLALKIPPGEVFLLSVLGNLIPVIPLLLFLDFISHFLSERFSWGKKFFNWLFERTRQRSRSVQKYEMLGLIIFVGIPLPLTGAWTGCVAASLCGIRFWRAFFAITLGVLIAASVVTLLCLGIISLGRWAYWLIR